MIATCQYEQKTIDELIHEFNLWYNTETEKKIDSWSYQKIF